MKTVVQEFVTAARATLVLAVLLCGLYPVSVWCLGQLVFPQQAAGSLVHREGAVIGSRLIGQSFTGPGYFHPRPSAAGAGYDAASSGGSNLGPLSKQLIETVAQRAAAYRQENNLAAGALVPADAVTASASGLDPHISVQNALLQAPRVARARGMDPSAVQKKIQASTETPDLYVLGEARVNVLMLNLSLTRSR